MFARISPNISDQKLCRYDAANFPNIYGESPPVERQSVGRRSFANHRNSRSSAAPWDWIRMYPEKLDTWSDDTIVFGEVRQNLISCLIYYAQLIPSRGPLPDPQAEFPPWSHDLKINMSRYILGFPMAWCSCCEFGFVVEARSCSMFYWRRSDNNLFATEKTMQKK